MRSIYVLVAVVVGIAIGSAIGYMVIGHSISLTPSANSYHQAGILAQTCKYSFIRHFTTTLLMAYLSANTYGERVAKPIAISFANGFLTPCFIAPYGYPSKVVRVWGNVSIKAVNVSDGRITLGRFESMGLNFSIVKKGNSLEVRMGGTGIRSIESSVRVEFYKPPLVSKEATNVTMHIATLFISRISEYGYDKDETIKTYCTYEYIPGKSRQSMGKQCLVLSSEGVLLVNSSRKLGSSEIYRVVKIVPENVKVKQINSSAVELAISYVANLKGFRVSAHADEIVKLKDLDGAAIMVQCFAKEIKLSIAVGNETYTFNVDNQLLMKGSVSVK